MKGRGPAAAAVQDILCPEQLAGPISGVRQQRWWKCDTVEGSGSVHSASLKRNSNGDELYSSTSLWYLHQNACINI
jgi:hypothetical protein